MTIAGRGEDAAATGDLDVTDSLILAGAGKDVTLVQACEPDATGDCQGIDRVLHVDPQASGISVAFSKLAIRQGDTYPCPICSPPDPGAGIHNSADLSLSQVFLTQNSGAIWNGGNLTITNSEIRGNVAAAGGALRNEGTATVTNSKLNGNAAANFSGHGGAIYSLGPISIADSQVIGNSSGFVGGGIYGGSELTIVRSRVEGNAYGVGGWGGGIAGGGGSLTVDQTSFVGNEKGAIQWSGGMTITNSTFFRNGDVNAIWRGVPYSYEMLQPGTLVNLMIDGKIYNSADGVLTGSHLTVAGITNRVPPEPHAVPAGAAAGNVTLENSILTGEGVELTCDGAVTSLGHNIDSGSSCGFSMPGDLSGTNPMLGPWNFDGKSLWLRSPLAGSPAIDAANATPCPPTDARGIARPQDGDAAGGAACDIGAMEFCAGPPGSGVGRDACWPEAPPSLTIPARASLTSEGVATICQYPSQCNSSPLLSADGTLLAFESFAENLANVDACLPAGGGPSTRRCRQVYARDLETGVTELISADGGGQPAASDNVLSAVSADGRFVVFSSDAPLVPEDTDNSADVYLRDRELGVTELISVMEADPPANNQVFPGGISADGRFVGLTQGRAVVRDRTLGSTLEVGITDGAGSSHFETAPRLSADGRYAGFFSDYSGFVPGDTNGRIDAFVKDMASDSIERVSLLEDGTEPTQDSYFNDISADGRYVLIRSYSALDGSGFGPGLYLRDRDTGAVERVDVDSLGNRANGFLQSGALSSNGRFVAYSTTATNLGTSDVNYAEDVFLHDRLHRWTVRISTDPAGVDANDASRRPALDGSGGLVAFESVASNLVGEDADTTWDIFLADIRQDSDGDGEWDIVDNCPVVANEGGQAADADGDWAGDACDAPGTANIDCNGVIDGKDVLAPLRYSLGLAVSQSEPCVDPGFVLPSGWQMGDVDCSGGIDSTDAMLVLIAVADLPAALPTGCPALRPTTQQLGVGSRAAATW